MVFSMKFTTLPLTAQFIEEYADFLESHLEAWTVTTEGTLLPEIKRHYIRINPVDIHNPHPNEDPNQGMLAIANRPPGSQWQFPAKEIVDAGFLELVRYGIRTPCDPLIVDSLKVVDAVLKVDTPLGWCWHRYNHDGYGQQEDGGPFLHYGKGRAWPLLTGERGHYELAAGHDVQPFIQAMEAFASDTGLLPEQIWDEPDYPDSHLYFGKPTGSAMPLAWAHAEYIKLLRSVRDGKVFDWIPEVANRYLGNSKPTQFLEIWKFNRQICTLKAGYRLRIQAARLTLAIGLMGVALRLPKGYVPRHWKSLAVVLGLVMPLMWAISGLLVWVISSLIIVGSILIHGISGAPLSKLYGRRVQNNSQQSDTEPEVESNATY
jgi:glucoamylase